MDRDVGKVAMELMGDNFKPTMPLIKTVIGGAVKENIWQIVRMIKFLLYTFLTLNILFRYFLNLPPSQNL